MKNRGFTLIEVLIYLSLYAVLVGGAVVAAYNLFEASGRNQTAAMVDEEGQYLTAKIRWAFLDNASASPSFDVASDTLRLTWGSSTPEVISNPRVQVSDFLIASSGESVSFTLTAHTPNGFSYAQKF